MKIRARVRLGIACIAASAALFAIQQAASSRAGETPHGGAARFSYPASDRVSYAAQPYAGPQRLGQGVGFGGRRGGFGGQSVGAFPAQARAGQSRGSTGGAQSGLGEAGLGRGDGYLDDSINAMQTNYGRGGEGVPHDVGAKTEWVFARLMYSNLGDIGPPVQHRRLHRWSEDYPYADWVFAEGVQRLTRIDSRGADEVVDAVSDNLFNYPWIYANQVGNWSLSDAQAQRLREYLLRGGFLLADNFHGGAAWENFMAGMRKIFPDRPVEELKTSDEIYHTLYDVDERIQVPGAEYEETGKTYVTYVPDAQEPHWRAIRDDRSRIVVAICHNMHLGDSWEHADDPRYPEHFTSFAYRVGLDYLVYAMTH